MAPTRPLLAALQHLKRHRALYAGLLLFVLAVIFIDPLRESGRRDEWAYALTVRNLLETGWYRPHPWLAANPIFQVYWGALFAKLFGYSFSSLHLSTFVLALGGSVAFYGLLREHSIDEDEAGLLTLALLASPLVLQFSINFMTDGPFLMLATAAVFFYTRAVRLHSYRSMLIGSVLAGFAVLTRQFGIALPIGLALVWMTSRARKSHIPFYLAGLALPASAVLWQLYIGFLDPNWTMPMKRAQELTYLKVPTGLLSQVVMRPAVMLVYLALYASPILVFAGLKYASHMTSILESPLAPGRFRRELLALGSIAAYLALALLTGYATDRLSFLRLPYLPWSGVAFIDHPKFGTLMTILALGGAALLGRILLARFATLKIDTRAGDGHRVIDFVTISLFLVLLVYVDMYDWYLLCLIPYGLLVIGLFIKDQGNLQKMGMGLVCIALMAASALWVRARLSLSEAYWRASDYLLQQGIPASQISSQWEWTAYHEFDEYLADINYRVEPNLADFYTRWLREHDREARYTASAACPAPGKILVAVPYQTIVLRTEYICGFERK